MMQRDLKLAIRKWVRRTGFDVIRLQSEKPPQYGRFAVVDSCQIPNLGFLLDFFFGDVAVGTFVEVGAFDGYTYSNTWGLAAAGWRGFYIEPVASHAAQCRRVHSTHPHVTVSNLAISDRSGEIALRLDGELTTAVHEDVRPPSPDRDGLQSSGDETHVWATTLDSYLETKHVEPGFEVLVVDVEGSEDRVFRGFDIDHWHPSMMIIETTELHPMAHGHRSAGAALVRQLQAAGYAIQYKDTSNTIFVDHESSIRAFNRADRPERA